MAELDLDAFDDIVPLGSGGLGDVYKATRRSTGGQVAIKVLRDWSDHSVALQRAQRELRALVDLRGHSNVVNVEEVVESDGVLSIVMEYAPGGSVSDLLRARGGRLGFAESLLVGTHTAAALAAAHDRGIIHRDIKPHNLLIGAFGQVKVCDFGIASLTRSEAVADRTTSLSLRYASPEELRGEQEVGTAADIYSLAATLHQLLTGQYLPLPDGTAGSLPLRSWMAPDDVPADVEVEFRGLVVRCADRTPANRPTAEELVERFEELAGRLGSARVRALPLVTIGVEEATSVSGIPVVPPSDPSSAAPGGDGETGGGGVPGAAAAAGAGLAAAAGAAAGAAAAGGVPGAGVPSAIPDAGTGAVTGSQGASGPSATVSRPGAVSGEYAPTVAQPAVAAGAVTGSAHTTGMPTGTTTGRPPGPPPGQPGAPGAPPGPSSRSQGKTAVAVFAVLAALLAGGVAAFAFGWIGGDGDDATAAETTVPDGAATTVPDGGATTVPDGGATTVAPATTEAPATTVAAATTTTTVPETTTTVAETTTTTTTTTTTVPPRYDGPQCPGTGSCIEMGVIAFDAGEYVIEWAANFEPSTGATHAHFFWDVYDASQVGSASADQRPWELTDRLGFVPTGEMSINFRPAEATGICVTPADGNHAVIDPAYFHCALVAAGVPADGTVLWPPPG